MDEQVTERQEARNVPEMTIYEQLYRHLYDYHFGRITFLELLDTWKEILHLPSSAQQSPYAQHENS
jgi:hypothetical protein